MGRKLFLDLASDEQARAAIDRATRGLGPREEAVDLARALGRVLAEDLRAPVDVPAFDRSNMDGFAVRVEDLFGATELEPRCLVVEDMNLAAGSVPGEGFEVKPGHAVAIATGAILPRGANAVVMVEDTAPVDGDPTRIEVFRGLAPGANLSAAGSDIGRGEIVLFRGTRLGSRETALAAAVGAATLHVYRCPEVCVFSSGDEVVPPGEPLPLGAVHDSNGRVLTDAVAECGGSPRFLGILPDRREAIHEGLKALLEAETPPDLILLSGGTSKGKGDLNVTVLEALAEEFPNSPGLVVHGVALKPGKPFCFAVVGGVPVAVLPGFPTSAIFTFHEFVAPLLRRLGGRRAPERPPLTAHAPLRLRSAPGRTEYVLVDLVPGPMGWAAYPLGAGSGSVSTFSAADGFVRIPAETEFLEAGSSVEVHPLGRDVRTSDLVAIGSHCVGLDALLSVLAGMGLAGKSIPVGSQGGLRALARGEGDVAGCHLFDPETGLYNIPYLPERTRILFGWNRRQGVVFRPGDPRFAGLSTDEIAGRVHDEGIRMVSRNPGSGTRAILDKFLDRRGSDRPRPEGYHQQARSHHAVAAAVAQGRADWGITLDILAADQGLEFVFLQDERYDLIVREEALDRPGVRALCSLLESGRAAELLEKLGFAHVSSEQPRIISS
ncbi:MAG TPA: molybdopterin biosynthesis protein [Planctomycetes bacterium]|nr:molybdopterin biosynthesis protein [Planctomycetota bacterium]